MRNLKTFPCTSKAKSVLTYRAKPFLLLLALFLFNTSVFAQGEITIRGNILDGNGDPVIGASVVVKGTTKGVISDIDGNYSISAAPNATLIFSFVGYNSVEEAVNNRTKIDMTMFEGQEMEEVVVVGYGTVKRANMLGAVASMTTSDIQDIPTANLSTALEGRLAGVKISQSSGKPGAATTLQIRESSSYGAAEEPLFVIDGIVRDQDAFDSLDPSEVESISILKDASAAVYGARAAGGVVLVQTKRGKEGKVKVSYNGTVGLTQAINTTEMLSAYDHATMLNDGNRVKKVNETLPVYYSPDELAYFKDSIPNGGYDWLDGAWKTAMVTRHSLNISGGSKTVRYFIGGSYHYETGSIENLDLNKYSLRSTIDVDLFKGLTASFQMSLNNNANNTPMNPSDNANLMEETFRALLQNPKWLPPTITKDGVEYPVYQNGEVKNNPYAMWANNLYRKGQSNKSSYVASLRYQIPGVQGLSARLQFSQSKDNSYTKTYYERAYGYNFKSSGANGHIVRPDAELDSVPRSQISGTEYLEESMERSSSYQLNANISYSRKFGLHDISALFECEVGESDGNRVGWQRNGAQVAPGVDEQWAFEEKDRALSTNVSQGGRLGFVGRANYNYDGRYVGEFSFRYDASSKFSPENRWGFFPAGAIGWVVSEEGWFKDNVNFLDFLKFRASAGLLGNDGVRDFLWKYSFGVGDGILFGNQPTNGVEPKNGGFANPDITWQKTQTYNGGVDLRFWNNKISVNVDGFYKYTYDILAAITTTNPTTVGIPTSSNIRFNYGKMHAYGAEVEVGYYDKLPFDINYYVKGNFAWSEAMKLKVAQSPGAIGKWYDELKNNISNQPGAISSGIIRDEEELKNILMDNPNYSIGQAIQEGMLNYLDIRGTDGSEGPNGIFANEIAQDRTVIAALTTAPYTYGASLGLSWKGIRVDATFSGKFGHKVFVDKEAMAVPTTTNNVPSFWKDHWTPENRNAKYPRAADYGQMQQVSTYWMRDGHTLRLTDLNVSYSLPRNISEKFGISQLRVYFNTKNLWTIINPFDYKDANLSNYNGYPMTRTYNFGLSFTL